MKKMISLIQLVVERLKVRHWLCSEPMSMNQVISVCVKSHEWISRGFWGRYNVAELDSFIRCTVIQQESSRDITNQLLEAQ